MKKTLNIIFIFCSLLVLIFSFQDVKAVTPDFQHIITASYIVEESKQSKAVYNVKTTNTFSSNYLTSFFLRLPFEPQNINTKDSSTPIKIKSLNKVSAINIYELEIEFLRPVVGKGKVFDWSFEFLINNVILSHGMQSAIILPTFANDIHIISYNINLSLPKALGDIKYVYGNAGILDSGVNYFLNFVATRNQTPNVLVLIGPNQQYKLDISTNEELDNPISLPLNNLYQQVYFSEFPKRSERNSNESNEFILRKGDKISGIIDTKLGKETSRDKGMIYSSSIDVFKNKVAGLPLSGLSSKQKAEKIYLDLLPSYSINQYNISLDNKVELTPDKLVLNIEEANQLYRELLGEAGIESRGVYGYVFPIQPFERNEYLVEQHIWTEFWDGSEWISTDPAWLLSSKGINYFDNNLYHHLKFGNYFEIKDLTTFINTKRFTKITPLSEFSEIQIKNSLEISSNSLVYLNKELKIRLFNDSNQILDIRSIKASSNDSNIDINENILSKPIKIYPNEEYLTTVNLDYGFILFNRSSDISLNSIITTGSGNDNIKNQNMNITIQSNISSYISYLIIGLFIFIGGASIFGLSLYKVKVR